MEDLELKLIQDKWVSLEQFHLAKQEADKCGKSIWSALLKLGYLTAEDAAVFFAQETNIAYVRISDYEIAPEVLNLVDENFCRESVVIPLFKVKDRLFVAFSNPLDTALVDRLAKLSGCDIEPLISSAESITQGLDLYYGLEDRVFDIERFVLKQGPLCGISHWRESERRPLEIPISIKVEDKSVVLHYSSSIDGYTRNICDGGTAVGLNIFLFIPSGTNVYLEFKLGGDLSSKPHQIIKSKAEVVYCRMEKGQRYFLGIKFTEIEDGDRNKLLKLSGTAKPKHPPY